MNALARLDLAVARACRLCVVVCLVGLFALLVLGMVQRLVPAVHLQGYDELIELLFIWLTCPGAVALWREGSLYRVNALDRLLAPMGRRVWWIVIHLGMLAVAVALAVVGWDFVRMSGETTPYLQWDKAWWYLAIPLSGALMAIYSVAAIWRTGRGEITLRDDLEGL